MTKVGCTSVGSTTFENRSSTSSGHVSPSVGMSEPDAAIAARQGVAVAQLEHVDPRRLVDRVAQRDAAVGRREVDLAVVAGGLRDARQQLLDAAHDVLVVRVGLVPLDAS